MSDAWTIAELRLELEAERERTRQLEVQLAAHDARHFEVVKAETYDRVIAQQRAVAAEERANAAEAACAAMREALLAATADVHESWQGWIHEEGCSGAYDESEERDSCDGLERIAIVRAALASDAGSTFLARLAAAEQRAAELELANEARVERLEALAWALLWGRRATANAIKKQHRAWEVEREEYGVEEEVEANDRAAAAWERMEMAHAAVERALAALTQASAGEGR